MALQQQQQKNPTWSGKWACCLGSRLSVSPHTRCIAITSIPYLPQRYLCEPVTPPAPSSPGRFRRNRNAATRTLITVAIVLCAVVASMGLLFGYRRVGRSRVAPCGSDSCIKYTRSLEASMNPDLDPCEDFHRFVCSNWKPVAGGRSFLEDAELEFRENVMKQAVDTNAPEKGQNYFQKAVMFFKTCVRSTDDGVRQLKKFLEEIGMPWPDVKMTTDPLSVLVSLSIKWQCPVFFYAYVSSYAMTGPKLVVLESFLGARYDSFVAEYRSRHDNARHICQLHNALAEEVGKKYTHPSSQWCQGLAQVQHMLISRLDNSSGKHLWASYKNIYKFARNMSGNWIRSIKLSAPPHINVRGSMPVAVHNDGYMKALDGILRATNKEELLRFIGLTIVQVIGRFLSPKVATLVYGSAAEKHRRQARACYQLTDVAFPSVLSTSFLKYGLQEQRVGKVREVANVVVASETARLRQTKWLSLQSRTAVIKKLAGATVIIKGLKVETSAINASFPDMTGSFLINLAHLPSDYWFRYHVYEDSAATKTDWTNLWRQANASYAPHRLFVPSVYMHRRVFPDDAYESINYATIGSLIARQAASAHDLTGRHVDADGHRVTWMKDSERAVQDRIIGCVVEAFQNRYNGTPVATSVDRSALYDAWASLSPLLGALHFSPGFTEQSSGFQRYNPQQLFFMSLCFNACGQGEDGVRGFSAAAWCNIPLSLFRPFWDSFQCQEGSRMRSSVTCDEM